MRKRSPHTDALSLRRSDAEPGPRLGLKIIVNRFRLGAGSKGRRFDLSMPLRTRDGLPGHTYNRRRRQRALGKLTPVEYELAFTNQAAAVAA